MNNGGPLSLILAALKELGGYFVWADVDGEEYVIMSRRDFEQKLATTSEEQLDLLSRVSRMESFGRPTTANDMLEKINHDLALYQLQQAEEEEEREPDVDVTEEATGQFPLPPKTGKTVRFEPLRGDLSPELQE